MLGMQAQQRQAWNRQFFNPAPVFVQKIPRKKGKKGPSPSVLPRHRQGKGRCDKLPF